MPKNIAFVISDVHIGDGTPTVWYQSKVHDPYLVTVLEWVAEHADSIRELVLLGDLVDLWTYPPDVRPPSLADIIDKNPATLGPGGALAKAVSALPGGVTFLLGNHDGTLTPADIEHLSATVGPVKFVNPVHVVTGKSGARTAFAHGHLWTMFNAPDDHSPWNRLPVGHFVTRAFAYQMSKTLKPGQTVADLANMGAPTGFDLEKFLASFIRVTWGIGVKFDPSIAGLLLDYVCQVSGMDEHMPILLPGGHTTSIAEARTVYDSLGLRWMRREGSDLNAARAALADNYGTFLAWSAQRVAIATNSDLVVLGHTHEPVGGLTVSPVDYVNSGFQCPSTPDVPPKAFTFTVVDLEQPSGSIYQVRKTGVANKLEVAQFTAPRIPVIVSPGQDYSCYVRIENQSRQPLQRTDLPGPAHGYWVVEPPQTIGPGGRANMWIQDYPGAQGTDGAVTYDRAGSPLTFKFGCPSIGRNFVSGPDNNFIGKGGTNDWTRRGDVPWGLPVQVRYTVT
jgi:UDP-2,3-diacylglucosamine pyrophosphatase LpxH